MLPKAASPVAAWMQVDLQHGPSDRTPSRKRAVQGTRNRRRPDVSRNGSAGVRARRCAMISIFLQSCDGGASRECCQRPILLDTSA